jgi:hypothetical protein
MANVNKLLYGGQDPNFLNNLDIHADERVALDTAKRKIRDHLRSCFSELAKKTLGSSITPRFFTQGSDSYKTLNRPPHMPPQQMDLDDGMYLPVSYLQEVKPSVAADALFKLVDACLTLLAKREGWEIDTSKATCVRLIISAKAHIDLPIYSIPDTEFVEMAKAVTERSRLFRGDSVFAEAIDVDQDTWEALETDRVLLAHRLDGWKPSDPRKIDRWFRAAVRTYGEQLRRQCRYLKAWRDYHRLENLSSIHLMVCIWTAYEQQGRDKMPARDDLALARIAEQLPALLRGPMVNPTDQEEQLDTRLSSEDRRLAIAKANELANEIGDIVCHCYIADLAIKALRQEFGDRIPYRPDLVTVEQPARTVLSKPAAAVAAPIVGRSTSG